jgi:hypothetical protein
MTEQIKERVDTFLHFMKTPDGTPLVTIGMVDWLTEQGFFTAPASTKYHGAYKGGLFDHSLAVAQALVQLTEDCKRDWELSRSPYIVGMFHDLCKIDQYQVDNSQPYTVGEPIRWEHNPNTLLKGHGEKSVMLLAQFYTLTEEEIACIRYHMGAFTDKSEWSDYTGAVHRYPNVLWTHHADMLASHVKGV